MEPSDSSTRALTLDEAVSFAIILQKNEQLAEAHELFRRIIEAAPDHPRALHYAGVLAHQQGRNDEALALIERSLALAPDQADWCSNRGIVLQSDGRLEPAIASYRRAIALDPGHANAHNNLGVLLRATGRPVEAEAAYREAIRLNPEHIDAYTNLGILLNTLQRTGEAAACYCKVITLRPKYREARKLLALAHCTLGEFGKAAQIFEQWLDEEPDDPIARHMLAACTGRDVPARASNGFVQATFDSFASSFEGLAICLIDRLVAAMVEDLTSRRRIASRAGRGLRNRALRRGGRAVWRRLVGGSLRRMLAHAGKSATADQCRAGGGPTRSLRPDPADTLVYFGDLTRVITASRALRPHGLVFTLEHADSAASTTSAAARPVQSCAQPVERLLTPGLRSHIIRPSCAWRPAR
jgi:tetratricopeptide (TPR) repeat protein